RMIQSGVLSTRLTMVLAARRLATSPAAMPPTPSATSMPYATSSNRTGMYPGGRLVSRAVRARSMRATRKTSSLLARTRPWCDRASMSTRASDELGRGGAVPAGGRDSRTVSGPSPSWSLVMASLLTRAAPVAGGGLQVLTPQGDGQGHEGQHDEQA